MCLTFKDWSDEFRQGPITVSAGRRIVAKAHKVAGGWTLKGYGFCWMHPDARKAGPGGTVTPDILMLRTKRQALDEMKGLENRNS